ncbi:FluG domain protein [Aspergillus undulatus]|uniref:FluG domain protein n=1 Tax=Aspergillus undulatus TaxID=1810928 RepID=UPI003CCD72C0
MPRGSSEQAGSFDWNAFIQEADPEVESGHSDVVKEHIRQMKINFQKFTSRLQPADYKYWLQNITLRVIEGFLRWYLNGHKIKYQSSLFVFVRFWRMFWCEEMDRLFIYDLRRRMTKLVCTTLTTDYELDVGGKTQPPINMDDLLFSTYHLIAVTKIQFPTARCRQQLSTVRKMMTSTTSRPGTLVVSSGYMRKEKDSLKWKDIELFMVKHPEEPCQTLIMRVTHRLNKGKRNKGVPPVYIYTERNDNLALCVIQDILEYAIADGAFASEYIKKPRDVWMYTQVPGHRLSTPIHIKETVKEIPIFRKAVKDTEGNWVTSPTEGWVYGDLEDFERTAAQSAGYRKPGTLYKYRKGAAANIRHLDEESRKLIMGHARSDTFSYYIQIQDDTQSAFMGTPTRDALIKLATNAGLTRDPSAPEELSETRKQKVEEDKELNNLKAYRDDLRAQLISRYHQLQKGKDTNLYNEFEKAAKKFRAYKKKLLKSAEEAQRKEFFDTIGNTIIEQNYHGKPIQFEPDTSHIIPERRTLADLEFKNRDVDKVRDDELLEDRIRSLELRLTLYRLNVPPALQKRIRFDRPSTVLEPECTGPFVSKTGLECPVCLGRSDHQHERARTYQYARKDTLQKHFATHMLPPMFSKGRPCDCPGCEDILYSLPSYKHHQASHHKIIL